MFVTAHALNRLQDRLPPHLAAVSIRMLEAWPGEPGTVAYTLGTLPGKASTPDGSNGDVIVAVAQEGSVETVFYRRSSQDMSPGFFGATKVVDLVSAYTLRGLV